MTSQEYWAQREAEQLRHNLTEEAEIQKKIEAMYRRTYLEAQKDIASFYARYAKSEGLTLAEARQKVTSLEIKDYEEKAKKYVRLKDFSKQANAEMKLYNATMRINRLEMLKAEIGLELCENTAELEELLGDTLNERTLAEFERQAGILGETVHGNAKLAKSIVNASFQSGTFSERLWGNQVTLRTELESLLVSGLVQGKNPRALAPQLEKAFDVSKNAAERLMRTELARVQTDAQMESYKQAGYTQYMFITVGAAACQVCSKLNGEVFNVADMAPGTNAPPMHPNCRCSTAAYMDREKVWAEIEGGNVDIKEESLRTKDGGTYGVNWNKIKSKEYTERFEQLSGNPEANALAAQRARNALKNRDGKDTEEIYAISLTTGKDVSKITDQHYKQGIKRTEKFSNDLKRAEELGNKILLIHNHPAGLPPSIADINALLENNDAVGITVGHNGSIYYYSKPNRKISERDFNVALMKHYSYNQVKQYEDALMELSEKEGFDFRFL